MPSRIEVSSTRDEAARIVRSWHAPNNERRLTPGLPVVVILGATATGKTALAVRLAREIDGEVVNADSRYLYRGMDIGTAKPTPAEMQGVAHHLIDIVEPTEDYSVARFLDAAYAAVEDIALSRRVPVVAGGTPQYLRAFLEGWRTPAVPPDPELRRALDAEPTEALAHRLRAVDPSSAARIGPHNRRRMIRALEVFATTGRPMSELQGSEPPPYRFYLVGLRQPREVLYQRIDKRVRAMFAAGWLDEVRALEERGVGATTPSMTAHGYREALAVIHGSLTLNEAIEHTCRMVHRYVRHQETWFRKFPNVHWFDSSTPGYEAQVAAGVRAFLEGRSSPDGDRLPSGC